MYVRHSDMEAFKQVPLGVCRPKGKYRCFWALKGTKSPTGADRKRPIGRKKPKTLYSLLLTLRDRNRRHRSLSLG